MQIWTHGGADLTGRIARRKNGETRRYRTECENLTAWTEQAKRKDGKIFLVFFPYRRCTQILLYDILHMNDFSRSFGRRKLRRPKEREWGKGQSY